MFKLSTEADLRQAFRPKDRGLLELDPAMTFPLAVHDYRAWTHPAGGRVFLVFAVPGGAPTGIVFDSNGGGGTGAQLCSWCHVSSPGTGVGLLTATVNGLKRAGVLVCTDLSCAQKLEQVANLAGNSVRPAMEKLVSRMGQFASSVLKIDLTGQRR